MVARPAATLSATVETTRPARRPRTCAMPPTVVWNCSVTVNPVFAFLTIGACSDFSVEGFFGGTAAEKAALAPFAAVMTSVHVGVFTWQEPPQATNLLPFAGASVRTTFAP